MTAQPRILSLKTKSLYCIILLLFLLAAPLLGRTLQRETVYRSLSLTSKGAGNFEFLRHVIFEETGDIDVLFAGQSILWNAVDPQMIEETLSKKFTRPVCLRNIGYNWSGETMMYVLLRDLLQHRKVKVLVLGRLLEADPSPHPGLYELWSHDRDGEHVFFDVPREVGVPILATRIYDWPRKLLSALRADTLVATIPHDIDHTYGNLETRANLNQPSFAENTLTPNAFSSDEIMYSPETAKNFDFVQGVEGHFLEKILELAKQYHVQIAWLDIPIKGRAPTARIDSHALESSRLSRFIVGIPPSQLFEKLNDAELESLYYDTRHLNMNGTRYFTTAILPAIQKIMEQLYAESSVQ